MLISHVTVEYRTNPIGLGVQRPRFSWRIEAVERNVKQLAYHIQTSVEDSGWGHESWDSGWVQSDQSVLVEYDGPALQSGTRYRVRIRIQDHQGRTSEWNDSAWWMTGKLDLADWAEPQWIAASVESDASPMLRRSFHATKPIAGAIVFVSALGLYELELNGTRVGNDLFTPGWTSYENRLQTQTYDVTNQVHEGENVLGALLANGWYKGYLGWKNGNEHYGNRRALLLELELRYRDGSVERVVSDSQWSWQTSAIQYAELYHGETYDARLERPGWSNPGYSASDWLPVDLIERDKHILVPQENMPCRVTKEIHPQQFMIAPNGDRILDFGQNMVGWVQFTVEAGQPGDEVILEHAEVLDSDGNFYTANLRSARQTIRYMCKGLQSETWQPRFTFQGFRYVRVVRYPGELRTSCFLGKVIHSDLEQTGSFACSNPLVNQLQLNIVWGQRGNFLDVPTDCPQRDERLGWTGDAQVFIRTAAFNMQVAPFFTKWLRDLKAEQRPDGGVPHFIPDVPGLDRNHSSAAWGDAAVICPWTMYLSYGDKRLLAEQYHSMKSWVDYIHSQGDDPLLWNTGIHFGDWLAMDAMEGTRVGFTPSDLIATSFYAYSTSIVSKAAAVLGRHEEAAEYAKLHQLIAARFRHEFVTPSGRIAAPTQTAHVLPLMFGLVEGDSKRRIASDLARMIRDNGDKLTTGFVGTPYLCYVLSENGELELAYKLLQQEQFPSWLFSIRMGATTIWEHWDSIKEDGSFWSDSMNSCNHYAYGAVGEWMYRVVAGIDLDEGEPGYKRIRIQPRPGGGLTYANAEYVSMYGAIRSSWKLQEGRLYVDMTIPPNTSAIVVLPHARLEQVTESGVDVTDVQGLTQPIQGDNYTRFELASGTYSFRYPY